MTNNKPANEITLQDLQDSITQAEAIANMDGKREIPKYVITCIKRGTWVLDEHDIGVVRWMYQDLFPNLTTEKVIELVTGHIREQALKELLNRFSSNELCCLLDMNNGSMIPAPWNAGSDVVANTAWCVKDEKEAWEDKWNVGGPAIMNKLKRLNPWQRHILAYWIAMAWADKDHMGGYAAQIMG